MTRTMPTTITWPPAPVVTRATLTPWTGLPRPASPLRPCTHYPGWNRYRVH